MRKKKAFLSLVTLLVIAGAFFASSMKRVSTSRVKLRRKER